MGDSVRVWIGLEASYDIVVLRVITKKSIKDETYRRENPDLRPDWKKPPEKLHGSLASYAQFVKAQETKAYGTENYFPYVGVNPYTRVKQATPSSPQPSPS